MAKLIDIIDNKNLTETFNERMDEYYSQNDPDWKYYWNTLAHFVEKGDNAEKEKINKLIAYIFDDTFGVSVPCFLQIDHEIKASDPTKRKNIKKEFSKFIIEPQEPPHFEGSESHVGETQTGW